MATFVSPRERLVSLDALRGIASLAVAIFHIYVFSAVGAVLGPVLPRWVDTAFRNGGLGVEVFFVISGVAIATSIAGARMSWGYIGRFALRRSIRLDPPYWATLALAVILLTLADRAPSIGRVLAHVVYLQLIVHEPNIVSVFWTLTFEVQFYIVLVLVVFLAQRSGMLVGWVVAVVPFLVSLSLPVLGLDPGGWFILWWYAFATGVATMGMLNGRLSLSLWLAVIALDLGQALWIGEVGPAIVALTAALIGAAGRAGVVTTWTGGNVLQWLGRRSYSLYLIHFVGANLAKIMSPRVNTPVAALGLFILATSIALFCAELLYRLIELPAHRLSRNVGTLFANKSAVALGGGSVEARVDQSIA